MAKNRKPKIKMAKNRKPPAYNPPPFVRDTYFQKFIMFVCA